MKKIQQMSRAFKNLFQFFFVALLLLQVMGWINAPEPMSFFYNVFNFNVIPNGYPVLHALTLTERLWGFLIGMIPTGIELIILYFLINLFRLYENGEIFSFANANYIKKIGYTLLIGQLIMPIYQALMGLAITLNNPHGYRFIRVSLHQGNLGILVASILIIYISWLMAEGCKLSEDQQLTI